MVILGTHDEVITEYACLRGGLLSDGVFLAGDKLQDAVRTRRKRETIRDEEAKRIKETTRSFATPEQASLIIDKYFHEYDGQSYLRRHVIGIEKVAVMQYGHHDWNAYVFLFDLGDITPTRVLFRPDGAYVASLTGTYADGMPCVELRCSHDERFQKHWS